MALERRLEEGKLSIQAGSLGKRNLGKVKSCYKGSNVGVCLGYVRKSKAGMWVQESEWDEGDGLRGGTESDHIKRCSSF